MPVPVWKEEVGLALRVPPVDMVSSHAIVTGGSGGVGVATARLPAERGARISLIAREHSDPDAAADEPRATGATVDVAREDVAKRDDLAAAVGLVADHGPCDVLVTCAGATRPGYVPGLTGERPSGT
nr:SDR family NAD(P)-dependent oxidoreductase [Streptomyces sp. TLI_235]